MSPAPTAVDPGPPLLRRRPDRREPDTEDASGAQPWDIGLVYDLAVNLFVTAKRTPSNTRAQQHQHHRRGARLELVHQPHRRAAGAARELLRGPNAGPPPAPDKWVVIREKASGYAPGFTARDANGETWFVSFDPPSNPKGATAAMVIANRLFWALGYNQVETFLTSIDPRRLEIDPKATVRRPIGRANAVHAETISMPCSSARHGTPTAPTTPRRPGCCRARSSGRSATKARARTIPTTSCRTSIDASCARCACSARGRTSPT